MDDKNEIKSNGRFAWLLKTNVLLLVLRKWFCLTRPWLENILIWNISLHNNLPTPASLVIHGDYFWSTKVPNEKIFRSLIYKLDQLKMCYRFFSLLIHKIGVSLLIFSKLEWIKNSYVSINPKSYCLLL